MFLLRMWMEGILKILKMPSRIIHRLSIWKRPIAGVFIYRTWKRWPGLQNQKRSLRYVITVIVPRCIKALIQYGIDLVLQSATKYINGHSDVVAGVLSGTKAMMKKIFNSEYMNMGIGATPFNAWLMIRGLRTLPLRLAQISATTEKVVHFLKNHEKVEEVVFPFDKDFPQYELAKKQMKGAGGLFSFTIKANKIKEIENFCENLRHILMAVSWGGHESLIIPGCASIKENEFDAENKDHRKLRMYVGLEEPDYIIENLERGFAGMGI